MPESTLEVLISARDQFTPVANRVIGTLGRMQRAAGGVTGGLARTTAGLTRLGLVAATALVGGLAASARVAGDFEAQLRTINTVARLNEAALREVGEGIRRTARETGAGLEDLTAGYYDLLSAGIKVEDAQGVLDAAVRLGIGGLATTSQSVDLLTTAINAWQTSASDATRISDIFAKSIEIGKVKADEIAASLANVAPIAAQNGIEIEEVAAAYAALTAQGTPAAEVTTQMARSLVELMKPKKELEDFQEVVGKSYIAIAGDKGLVVALQQMRDDAERLGVPFQNLFGRVEALKFAYQTTGPQAQLYADALAAMGDSAGTAAAQMAERQQGLNFQFARLKANVLDAALSLAEGFLPALGRLADKLTRFVSDHRDELTTFGQQIGAALDAIDFEALLTQAERVAGIFEGTVFPALRGAADLFGDLPPHVQGLTGALLALAVALQTPVIGGALRDVLGGLGQIGGSLAAVVARRGAAQIPGIGRLFAQPVTVISFGAEAMAQMAASGGLGGGGGIGGAAKGAGLLAILGKAGLVALPIGLLAASWESMFREGERIREAGGPTAAELQVARGRGAGWAAQQWKAGAAAAAQAAALPNIVGISAAISGIAETAHGIMESRLAPSRAIGRQLQATLDPAAAVPLAAALATGFEQSLAPSLDSMTAHLARLTELTELARSQGDTATAAKLDEAIDRVKIQIAQSRAEQATADIRTAAAMSAGLAVIAAAKAQAIELNQKIQVLLDGRQVTSAQIIGQVWGGRTGDVRVLS